MVNSSHLTAKKFKSVSNAFFCFVGLRCNKRSAHVVSKVVRFKHSNSPSWLSRITILAGTRAEVIRNGFGALIATIAQLAERRPSKSGVASSNLARGSIFAVLS